MEKEKEVDKKYVFSKAGRIKEVKNAGSSANREQK